MTRQSAYEEISEDLENSTAKEIQKLVKKFFPEELINHFDEDLKSEFIEELNTMIFDNEELTIELYDYLFNEKISIDDEDFNYNEEE